MRGRSMTAVVGWVEEFTRQARRENGVSSTAVERGPISSDVGNMEMEEKRRGDPHDQPCQDQQMPRQACLNHWCQISLSASAGTYEEGVPRKACSAAADGRI